MAEDKMVLSYYDSLLRQSDLSLLDPPHWINDKLIGFYLEYLERQYSVDYSVSFITPDVTQFIKLYTTSFDELQIFLSPLQLYNKDIIILVINNNSSVNNSGGSHWSTLIFDRNTCTFQHYDSLSPSNQIPAKQCAVNLSPFLFHNDKRKQVPFVEEVCSQQENSYDCGVYAVLFAESYCESKRHNMTATDNRNIAIEHVMKWRQDTKKLIHELSNVH